MIQDVYKTKNTCIETVDGSTEEHYVQNKKSLKLHRFNTACSNHSKLHVLGITL